MALWAKQYAGAAYSGVLVASIAYAHSDRLFGQLTSCHVTESEFDAPVWRAELLTMSAIPVAAVKQSTHDTASAADEFRAVGARLPIWRRCETSHIHRLLPIVLDPRWDRVRVQVKLPAQLRAQVQEPKGGPGQPACGLQWSHCTAIWEATSIPDPQRASWIFETDCGLFADPTFRLGLDELTRGTLRWRDCEDDWNAEGRLKLDVNR